MSQIREQVTEGASLADALKAHPRIFFGDLDVNMVRAGEALAALYIAARLADYTEKDAALRCGPPGRPRWNEMGSGLGPHRCTR